MKKVLCPKCKGFLQYQTNVVGVLGYGVSEDGTIDWDHVEDDYTETMDTELVCLCCKIGFHFDRDEEGRIVLDGKPYKLHGHKEAE